MNKTYILVTILLFSCSLFLSCERSKSPSEKVPSNAKHSYKTGKSDSIRYKTSPEPWSNSILWGNLVKNGSHASFSVKISDKLPEFKFSLHGEFKDKDFHPSYVEIINSSNSRVIQKIEIKDLFNNYGRVFSGPDLFLADLVQLVDLNNDGYLDLRILFETGGTGNNWYVTYIYEPELRRFKYHETLSLLSAVTVDQDSKLIKTYWRIGWCTEFREYFKLMKNGRLILKKVEWTERDNINAQSSCLKITAVPLDNTITYHGHFFYTTEEKEFAKLFRKTVRVVKKEELKGSMDGRSRGPLGTPLDR